MERTTLYKGLFVLFIFIGVLFAYQKSYDNQFHFDDSHTIVENAWIQDLSNIPDFFTKGAETFSNLPANQVYRPIVTTSVAIDYALAQKFYGNGFDTHTYHYSMMFFFFGLLILMYFFQIKLFQQIQNHDYVWFAAMAGTAIFAFHTVVAETMNYIISRSDLISTFFVMLAFVLFQYFPKHRKYGFFLIPFLLALLTKNSAAMFIPMLMIYYYLFEYRGLPDREKKSIRNSLLMQAITLVIVMIAGTYFTLAMQGEQFSPSNFSRWSYLITMPIVSAHYFVSFFIPYHLSADTDWTVLQSIFDLRFFAGITFVIFLLFIAWKWHSKVHFKIFSFSILWFFVVLAPTSSLVPLAEVLNDHRMFFPFVGLSFSFGYALLWFYKKYENRIQKPFVLKISLLFFLIVIYVSHIYGVRQRTEVWDNAHSLWKDVTIKSPNNGRGLMNFGLELMREGRYDQAMHYYRKAYAISPNYSYLNTNMAICFASQNRLDSAEFYYKRAVTFGSYSHLTHFYFARFLHQFGRYNEAQTELSRSLRISQYYLPAVYLQLQIYTDLENWEMLSSYLQKLSNVFPKDETLGYYKKISVDRISKIEVVLQQVKQNPSSDNYLNLSLLYYNIQNYEACIEASKKAIEIDPNDSKAYNNVCAAFNVIGNYDEAIHWGEKAIQIDPSNQKAKNNLALSKYRKQLLTQLIQLKEVNPLIDLSLTFYNQEMYSYCIMACEKALKQNPQSALAYNNICSAYIKLGKFEKAVEAGEKAVKIQPDYQLAHNNLALAKSYL